MKIKRSGKCETCQRSCVQRKVFIEKISIFEPDANPLRGELLKQLKTWRDSPIYCEEHEPIRDVYVPTNQNKRIKIHKVK